MRIEVREGSLTEGTETVLVNASNTNLELGSGVSGAIRQACGKGYGKFLAAELLRVFGGPMEPGEVFITDAGAHPTARYVAHVAVMDYREGFTGKSYPTLELIQRSCELLWQRIDALGPMQSVAMVALGAGTGNLGVIEPMRIAARTLKAAKTVNVERVVFYGYELPEFIAVAGVIATEFPEVRETLPAEVLRMI